MEGGERPGLLMRTDVPEVISTRRVGSLAQTTAAHTVSNPNILTSYSWRRYPTTLASLMNMSPLLKLALSDWLSTKARE